MEGDKPASSKNSTALYATPTAHSSSPTALSSNPTVISDSPAAIYGDSPHKSQPNCYLRRCSLHIWRSSPSLRRPNRHICQPNRLLRRPIPHLPQPAWPQSIGVDIQPKLVTVLTPATSTVHPATPWTFLKTRQPDFVDRIRVVVDLAVSHLRPFRSS